MEPVSVAATLLSGIDPETGAPYPNVNNLLGVMLICGIFAAFLYGVSVSQTYLYYDRFPKDPWYFKLLVAITWALDTLHTILLSHTIYHYTVTFFGNYRVLHTPTVFSFNLEVVVVPMMATITQFFFAWRVWANDRNNWLLAGLIALLALAQLGFGFGSAVLAFTKMKGFYDLPRFNYILVAWLSTGAAGDILVTVSLVWTFYSNKTTFTEEDGVTTRWLMYLVHTGALTTFVTFLDLAFVIAMPDTTVFTGLNYVLGKLYVNTLLYALNRRHATDATYGSSGSHMRSGGSSSHGMHKPPVGPSPPFAANGGAHHAHTLSAPRVAVRDPYAPDMDMDGDDVSDGKPGSLTEDALVRGDVNGPHVVFKPDQGSDVSYITMDHKDRLRREDSDF